MYCEKCKRIIDRTVKCPSCGSRRLRDVLPEDPCYLTETDPMFGGMLKDVLEQNGFTVISSSAMGAGLAMRVGPMFDRVRFYVPYTQLPAASELVEALFHAPALEEEPDQS